jgi:1,4-dihydroxy-2-naphthoyl-CoA hydrolase
MFRTTKRITLRDTDAAGVLYFARYLAMAHDAYEEFMVSRGCDFRRHVTEGEYLVPVVHAQSNYHRPLWLGDMVTIQVNVAEINRRTFHIAYELYGPDEQVAASCKTIHVAVNKQTGRAIPLPSDLLAMLK